MNKYQKDFIENLKKYRKKKGLSQAQLAEFCNISTGTIGNIECGIAKPSFDLILTISEILDIHPALLLLIQNPAPSDTMQHRSLSGFFFLFCFPQNFWHILCH